jgi:A/G-specific adenine glycosylase
VIDRPATVARIIAWYDAEARDLPWRRPRTSPWAVLVSEIMLQQTPVSRVLEPWTAWVTRWPTPAALAAAESSAAVEAWGRLGYPRRALRLWQAAGAIVRDHGGVVPGDEGTLRTLPGIGDYTAAAVAAFAYGRRAVVLDTNVRRLLARLEGGQAFAPAHLTLAERRMAEAWLPQAAAVSVRWNVAAMELGALVCRATAPACVACPVQDSCRWFQAGRPPSTVPRPRQLWHGTDRQCRGVLLAALREGPQERSDLLRRWPDGQQADRCLHGLLVDGLARVEGGTIRL